MENEEDTLLKDIEDSLCQLRDSVGNPYDAYEKLFSYLDNKLELEIFECDVILIRVIEQVFKKFTLDADIVLMALGLLDGYSYKVIYRHTDRRIKFLRETTYLGLQKLPYDEAGKSKQESYRKTIIKDENERLHSLANFLKDNRKKLGNFLVDIEDYVDGGMAILPIPGYIKGDNMRENVRVAVIKYLYLGKEIFSEVQKIVIKNNECNIKIDLSKKLAYQLTHTKAIALSAVAPLIVSIVFTAVYVPKYIQHSNSNTTHDNGVETIASADVESVPNDNNNSNPIDPF